MTRGRHPCRCCFASLKICSCTRDYAAPVRSAARTHARTHAHTHTRTHTHAHRHPHTHTHTYLHTLFLQAVVDGRVQLELLCALDCFEPDDNMRHNLAIASSLNKVTKNSTAQRSRVQLVADFRHAKVAAHCTGNTCCQVVRIRCRPQLTLTAADINPHRPSSALAYCAVGFRPAF
jgi:hypothetical protein